VGVYFNIDNTFDGDLPHSLWNWYPDGTCVHALGNHTGDLGFIQSGFDMWKGLLTTTGQEGLE